MGGRGASSGKSNKGKDYGTEYTTIHKISNIKFIKRNEGGAVAPLETMTSGRIYVTVNNQNKLKSISCYDNKNKRYKQIDIDHEHKINKVAIKPHVHKGYNHNEKGDRVLTSKEQRIFDRVNRVWYYYTTNSNR